MKTLKNNLLLIIGLLFTSISFSQTDLKVQNDALKKLEKGLQKKDYTTFKSNLSPSYEAGGYGQPLVDQVIPQILAQYPVLTSLQILSVSKKEAVLNYEFKGLESQKSKVIFDDKGLILKIELFDNLLNPSKVIQNTNNAKSIEKFTTKFNLINNLIFVDVILNGKTESFILDSGAPTLILNSAYFKSTKTENEAKGVTGSTAIQNIKIESFNWNGILLESTEVLGMDLTHLEKETGKVFKGLIGYSMLKDYELYIDYSKKELTLFKDEQTKYHSSIKPKAEFDFNYGAHIPVIDVIINNKTYKLGLDTGASSNLIDLNSFKNISAKSYIKKDNEGLYGADKNEANISVISLKSYQIKSNVYKDQEFAVSDISHLKNGYNLEIDGLLGFPFLSEHQISIDFVNQKIYLW